MWQRQRPWKRGFIQGAPGVRKRFMCHVYIHSLIIWRCFKYFISLQPLGVSRETLQKTNLSQNPIPAGLKRSVLCLQFALPHSSAADIVTSLTEVLI